MSEISASDVMKLRSMTGAPMMDCKKALVVTEGNIEAAIDHMRKAGQLKAEKKADRATAEGALGLLVSNDKKTAVLVELNCETDFVARDDNFQQLLKGITEVALRTQTTDVEALAKETFPERSQTIDEARKDAIAKLGENISLRRVAVMTSAQGFIGSYLHGNRIGVLAEIHGGNETVGKDVAMHVAANSPSVANVEDFDPAILAHEKEIIVAQLQDSNKPKEIIEKIVEGRLQKFKEEHCLTGQPFLRDDSISVGKYLDSNKAKVLRFVRLVLGEGIEKKVSSFVDEVMAQARG